MNNPNCGACGMLNSRGFCSLTACRFPVVNGLGTWQERILANKPKQTNADRIRGMSDEELADWIETHSCPVSACNELLEDNFVDCHSCWLSWLKSPADKEEKE